MRRLLRATAIALTIGALPLQAATETERLVTLARVWSTAKYFHPYFAYRDMRWDQALLRTIPKVRAARDDAAFEAAVASMLAGLGDPATRLEAEDPPRPEGFAGERTTVGELDGDTFILRAGESIERAGPSRFRELVDASAAEIARARSIVVDLRTANRNASLGAIDEIGPMLTRKAITAPGRWTAIHSGFAPDREASSGLYFSGLKSYPGRRFAGSAAPALERVAFIVSPKSTLPELIVALKREGRAVLVADTALTEAAFAKTTGVPLGTGKSAIIRTDELAMEVAADAIVGSSDPGAAIARARELLRGPGIRAATPRAVPAAVHRVNDAYSSILGVPPLEMRLLAAFRLWSVIDRFYPYKHLIGDWDAAFAESIPNFLSASTRHDYVGAILELAAHIEDGHSTVSGPGVPEFFGEHFVDVDVRLVQGRLVVATLGEKSEKAGLRVGDVVVDVDGEPLQARVKRMYGYSAGSTEKARTSRVARFALRGAAASVARLTIERGTEQLTVAVPRVATVRLKEASTPVYRMLTNDVGYADLGRLEVREVESMFFALRNAKSILFDMRGYPKATAWAIAPRLGSGEPRVAARLSRPQIIASSSGDPRSGKLTFTQPLPDGRSLNRYQGRTYMLVDDRTISQAEHTGLFFEAANGTRFIGTPTAGTDGDMTTMVLPGALYVSFSGHEVRHANGDPLQRVGLVPALLVEPTVTGLQGGKDEVLEKAIAYAEEQLSKKD
jgi:C-terminal processing protease CtpA/Prc